MSKHHHHKKPDHGQRRTSDGREVSNTCKETSLNVSDGLLAKIRGTVSTNDFARHFLERVADRNSTPQYIRESVERPKMPKKD
jgi:hypothetical protein